VGEGVAVAAGGAVAVASKAVAVGDVAVWVGDAGSRSRQAKVEQVRAATASSVKTRIDLSMGRAGARVTG
jgi:hypothetical protein